MNKTPIVWTPNARMHLHEIFEYIKKTRKSTAERIVRRITDAIERLELFPESGAVVETPDRPGLREIFVKKYRVIYRYADAVTILGVYHGARRLTDRDLSE